MGEEMEFPNTFEEFLNDYSFKDSEEVYTNGSELIQTFRVMQGYEHFRNQIREEAIDEFVQKGKEKQTCLLSCKYLNEDVSCFECIGRELKAEEEKTND